MTIVIRDGHIYEKIFYGNEDQFEAVALRQLRTVLPGFWVVPFKPLLTGEYGERRRPDLAIIERHYRLWAVVEVELSSHSLDHHVRPQMETLVSARFETSHADRLAADEPDLDQQHLRDLFSYVPPEFVVVADCPSVKDKGWQELKRDLGAHLTFVETFRTAHDDPAFLVSGFLPEIRPEQIATLRKHQMMNALICRKPGRVVGVAGRLRAYSGERCLEWRVTFTADAAMLFPPGGVTLNAARRYEMLRSADGRIRIDID